MTEPVYPNQKLCVCGRSANFPVCDNSHEDEGWTCASDVTWSRVGFCSSYRYQNLARKLASHYNGALLLPGEPRHAVDTLVTIVDGMDLEFPLSIQSEIQAKKQIVTSLGAGSGLLHAVFPGSQILDLGPVTVFVAFKEIRRLLDSGDIDGLPPTELQKLSTAFVSHAVKDEPLIMPTIRYLREVFSADLFLCADSIEPGTNWQDTIYTALQEKEVFVVILSEAVRDSHFCSFEFGVAYALNKPMVMLSLDGVRPLSFVQHIQAVNLPRIAQQKPWLSLGDILLEELLLGLTKTQGVGRAGK